MFISNIKLDNNIFLAPMAGITDMPFRLLCKEQGCGLVYSEMISAKGLFYKDNSTEILTEINKDEMPCAIQIFGSDPEIMAEAAAILNDSPAALIDINMGCPTPKITKCGEGSALMKDPDLAGRIVQGVVRASTKPVTVKIRSGWDDESINAVHIAQIAEENGASAVCVHGRTRQQFYSGFADYNVIASVKESVSIPVIGNGDITSYLDVIKMVKQTNCDAVMVGRAARGNPWIFNSITSYFSSGAIVDEPDTETKIDLIKRHLNMAAEHKGEYKAVREMRKHIGWYLKGLKNSNRFKQEMFQKEKIDDVINLLDEYLVSIQRNSL